MTGSGSGSGYWDAFGWDPDERVYAGTGCKEAAAVVRPVSVAAAADAAAAAKTQPPRVVRTDSGESSDCGFWDRMAGTDSSPPVKTQQPALLRTDSDQSSDCGFWDRMADTGSFVPVVAPVTRFAPPARAPAPADAAPPAAPPSQAQDQEQPRTGEAPEAQKAAEQRPNVAPVLPSAALNGAAHPSPSPQIGSAQGDSGYWDAGGWGSSRAAPVKRQSSRKTMRSSKSGSMGGKKSDGQVSEANSDSYWDAGQWDPDERVYVGAEDGAKHHRRAVDPSDVDAAGSGAKLSRAWAGGLLTMQLGLAQAIGPPIDLCDLLGEERPTLKDAFDMLNKALGSGSFGVVRHAKHRATDAVCVVKAVKKASAGDQYRANLIEHGLGETLLRMTRDTPHENITRYFDMLEGPSHFYVIMEELTGPELLQYMEELFPVTEVFINSVMKQILSSLAHLHDVVGLFHRDVKLANYRFRGRVDESPLVLLDFGFASSTERPWDGTVCGTAMFMPPELVAHTMQVPHLQASDLWAAGVILYVLLTGDSPFEDSDVKAWSKPDAALSEAAAMVETALMKDELRAASESAIELLRAFLSVDPKERITAAQALQHRWFVGSAPSPSRRLLVSGERYRSVRSRSMMSEVVVRRPLRRASSGALSGSKRRSNSTPNLRRTASAHRERPPRASDGGEGSARPSPPASPAAARADAEDDGTPSSTSSPGLARIISAGSMEDQDMDIPEVSEKGLARIVSAGSQENED